MMLGRIGTVMYSFLPLLTALKYSVVFSFYTQSFCRYTEYNLFVNNVPHNMDNASLFLVGVHKTLLIPACSVSLLL